MKAWEDMTTDEKLAERNRRNDRRARGLPINETPAELEARLEEEDARLEKEIQAEVVKRYRAQGYIVYTTSQPRASKISAGIPDIYVQARRYGVAWWHETKTPTGKESFGQKDFREGSLMCGIPHVVGGVAMAELVIEALSKQHEKASLPAGYQRALFQLAFYLQQMEAQQ